MGDDPLFRQYLISRNNGIDLLLEDGSVIAIQIFVQATKKFAVFNGILPFGVDETMHLADVHRLLGNPTMSDAQDSTYFLREIDVKLVIYFDGLSKIKYMSVEVLQS